MAAIKNPETMSAFLPKRYRKEKEIHTNTTMMKFMRRGMRRTIYPVNDFSAI
jgi:hypothetical protein